MRRLTSALSAVAVVGAIALSPMTQGVASADGAVPWGTDPNQQGLLTLCDAEGHMITKGNIYDKPFADYVVSDTHARAGYDHNHAGKETLFAYTPVQNVDPGDWISFQITAASYFSDDAHPMAEITNLDYTLHDYVYSYPHRWDGLVQLRFALGAARQPLVLFPYPAMTLKIDGDKWHVVQGGPDDCATGRAISIEKIQLKSRFPTPLPVGATVKPTDSPLPRHRVVPSGSSTSGPNGVSGSNASSATSSGSSSGPAWLWVLLGIVGLALAGTGVAVVRARRSTAPRS